MPEKMWKLYAWQVLRVLLTVIKSPESPPSRRRRREDEAVEGEREARRKGRRVLVFEKKPWPEVESNPRARAYVSSLGLGADHFEN